MTSKRMAFRGAVVGIALGGAVGIISHVWCVLQPLCYACSSQVLTR